ncbi:MULTISPECIES: DUF4176 domain-containing protein [Lactococcus]|nr:MULTISPECIES: DUF4176 domain-containing protein [Lactococcus]MCA2389133.1 DUF4176 domain-containing protein [Lactococcus sp. NH2-7C]MCI1071029.1 DUF4176 domain-containing protein [Lactococcus lactis]WGV30680.1 DUF4176 domain-containing protein [Lactococcus sp. NH2-7C]
MRELKEFLPLGSVVLLAGGNEKLMIIGYKQAGLESNSELDYSAIVIPEGYQNLKSIRYFNQEEVVYIFQMGFLDN